MVTNNLNTALTGDSNVKARCKPWFVFYDGVIRAIFGAMKGAVTVARSVRAPCMHDPKVIQDARVSMAAAKEKMSSLFFAS